MGYVKHQAVIAVVGDFDTTELHLEDLRAELAELVDSFGLTTGQLLAGPIRGLTNGYSTYLLAPDGSKEGWDASELGDKARAAFVSHFRKHARWADIVEVSFGGDYGTEFGVTAVDLGNGD